MVKEYKTILIAGWPDAMLSAAAVDGWRLVAVAAGGFDREGRVNTVARTFYLEREHQSPIEPALPASATVRVAPANGQARKRGRPPKTVADRADVR